MNDDQKPENEVQAQPAAMSGQAAIIRAKIHITRAGTGKVEDYDLIGTPEPEQPKEQK